MSTNSLNLRHKLNNKRQVDMFKYLWYCTELGISDDFETFKECETDAMAQCKEHGCELSMYCYDANKFPNGDVEIDDCKYLGYISLEK